MTTEHLFLVDSSIYVFRAWQSWPNTTHNRFNEPDNAVRGFTDTLCRIVESHQPSWMLCAFDECFRQGVRNQIYPAYKADRPPAPPDLTPQFARCKQVARALGITTLGSDRVEADDIIGHLAALAADVHRPVTIVSGDKDLAQFVRRNDRYWDFGRQPMAAYEDLHRRFRIRPEQIPDWLALCGDKSDNIPGVPGVGPSTAARLLIKWQDLDTLLANLDKVSLMRFRGAVRISRLLYEHRADIALARSLTGPIADDRLPSHLHDCQRQTRSNASLLHALTEAGLPVEVAEHTARRMVDC